MKQREMVAVPVFFSGDEQAIIVAISSTGINEAKDGSYLNASVQICIATTIVNVAAVVAIRRKDKTGVNGLIVTDCFANILTALVQLLDTLPSPTSRYVVFLYTTTKTTTTETTITKTMTMMTTAKRDNNNEDNDKHIYKYEQIQIQPDTK